MTNYCTQDDVTAELKADSSATADLARIRNYIRTVSKRIDELMGSRRRPFFAPYIEQRKFLINGWRIDSWNNVFWLDNSPLLAFTAVLWGTTDRTSVSELYTDRNEINRGLRLTTSTSSWYSSELPPVFVKVTGTWGWHEDWDNAFDAVDTLQANINATVLTLTVADADGADLEGYTPRFSPGNFIQIGTEWMEVTAVNTTTNVLTVRRGRNGSTAAAHTSGDDVEVYQVDIRIRRACIRQAAMLYARRGAFQVETVDGVGAVTFPQDQLAELKATLQGFMYG
jgi:hypothetical protein